MEQYGKNKIGDGVRFFKLVSTGFMSQEDPGKKNYPDTRIRKNAILRIGTDNYCTVTTRENISIGHNVIIREMITVNNTTTIETSSVIESTCLIKNNVRIQSMVFIPMNTGITNNVLREPNSVLTNDPSPPIGRLKRTGGVPEKSTTIGAKTVILPGDHILEGAVGAAGSVVTTVVPTDVITVGASTWFHAFPIEMRQS